MMKYSESHSSVAPLNIKSGAACRQLFTARLQHSLLVHAVQSSGNEVTRKSWLKAGCSLAELADFVFTAPVRSRAGVHFAVRRMRLWQGERTCAHIMNNVV
ncbi:hypothetical protein XH87_09485 [Bradyrhizobium sp. CCBAU 53415]|nr:hypothetical protein [Bradyrhizobium sp. CCBAU 53415]